MTYQEAAGAGPAHFIRLSSTPQAVTEELGPLAGLVGTWMGSKGWELIAVPSGDPGQQENFTLIVRPYIEILTFSSLGALVPDRGGPAGELFISGLLYDSRITDAETNEPLHFENGMWLLLPGQDQTVARLSVIPHGDTLLALGTSSTANGAPSFPVLNTIPDAGPDMPLGYTDPYLNTPGPFQTANANAVLADAIQGQDILQTVSLDVSTTGGGGILNIPFVEANANAAAFTSTFWIETVQDPSTGQTFQQLQYSQQTDIYFLPQFGNPTQLILWPHVNVNTLYKQ